MMISTLFVMLLLLIVVGGASVFLYKRFSGKKSHEIESGVCPKCGKKLSEDSVYCEYCGTKVKSASAPLKRDFTHDIKFKYIVAIALVHIVSLGIAYSVHWETFAYYGIDYEGYPTTGAYNGIFFICVVVWIVTLVLLLVSIYNYKNINR